MYNSDARTKVSLKGLKATNEQQDKTGQACTKQQNTLYCTSTPLSTQARPREKR